MPSGAQHQMRQKKQCSVCRCTPREKKRSQAIFISSNASIISCLANAGESKKYFHDIPLRIVHRREKSLLTNARIVVLFLDGEKTVLCNLCTFFLVRQIIFRFGKQIVLTDVAVEIFPNGKRSSSSGW